MSHALNSWLCCNICHGNLLVDGQNPAPPKKPWFLMISLQIPTNVMLSTMVSFRWWQEADFAFPSKAAHFRGMFLSESGAGALEKPGRLHGFAPSLSMSDPRAVVWSVEAFLGTRKNQGEMARPTVSRVRVLSGNQGKGNGPRNPRELSETEGKRICFLKRTMVENNGKGINPWSSASPKKGKWPEGASRFWEVRGPGPFASPKRARRSVCSCKPCRNRRSEVGEGWPPSHQSTAGF